MLTRKRAVLTQYQSRLELLAGQLGALFFVGEQLAGVEIAPDLVYFAEIWMALVCFAYGPAAWFAAPGPARTRPRCRGGFRRRVAGRAGAAPASVADEVGGWLARAGWQPADLVEEERYLDLRLSTVAGEGVGGQVVTDGSRLVYASLFATAA